MKKIVMCILLVLSCFVSVHAETEKYDVIRLSDETLIASYDTYEQASEVLSKQKDAGIVYRGQLIAMDSGVVVLKHNNCTVNIDTIYEKTDENGYVNGCYGNDGLYLRTNATGKWILMLMSGARMWVHRDDVTLVPYQDDLLLSSYFVSEDHLFHQIRTRWKTDDFGSVIDLGKAPDMLQEEETYLSYDGHYFYTDFSLLSMDMKNERHDHARNKDTPYYNYFMVLPHRSMSQYDASDFEAAFQQLQMTSAPQYYVDENSDSVNDVLNCSQLAGALDSFVYAQSEFGSNALLMLALSLNESASGRSSLAYRRNNLFGHAAYDSDVEGNAKRYFSVENSVISHAKNYISLSYANPDKFTYHGSFFGDKNSGMNVSYASDPYWSEKAASYAAMLDDALGQKERDAVALAIVDASDRVEIYDESFQHCIADIEIPMMSFVILAETDESYLVQLDEALFPLLQQGSYDFIRNTGYLDKRDVQIVLNPDKIAPKEVLNAVFKASGGTFKDGTDTKILQFEKGREMVCEAPVKEMAVFDKWIETAESVFEAQYRTISSIAMKTLPDQVTELNVPLDLRGGSIEVVYEDGTSEIVELTTSMVSGYSLSEAKDQNVTVTYGGASVSYPLRVSLELDEARSTMEKWISEAMMINTDEQLKTSEIQMLIDLKALFQNEFYPVLSMSEIIHLDRLFQKILEDEVSVILDQNEVDLSVSGLYLSKSIPENKLPFGKPVIKIQFKQATVSDSLKKTVLSQGWQIEDEFVMDMKVNGQSSLWEGPVLLTMRRFDETLKQYAVFSLQEGDVLQCHTAVYQDCIRFKALHPGEYVLASKPSVNTYDSIAMMDVTLFENNGFDYDVFFKVALTGITMVLLGLIGGILLLKKRLK